MSLTVIGFAVMACIATLLAVATLVQEYRSKSGQFMQFGDTSLTPRSVNWLAATASAGAVLICFGLR